MNARNEEDWKCPGCGDMFRKDVDIGDGFLYDVCLGCGFKRKRKKVDGQEEDKKEKEST